MSLSLSQTNPLAQETLESLTGYFLGNFCLAEAGIEELSQSWKIIDNNVPQDLPLVIILVTDSILSQNIIFREIY